MNIIHGDCLEELKKLEDNSIDAVVCDPPYGLSNTKPQQVADVLKAWVTGDTVSVPAKRGGSMGASWDSFVPPPAVWEECMRVLKPGGHMAVFAGARTQDLMGLSIRLAGFEIRDTLGWVYGCLSEDTEVLINGKWEKYHEAKPGDLALCYDREHDTYEWQPIEDTHKYEYGDTAYRIHSNNTDQIVSRNHRVLVERGGTYEFEYAENLAREHQIRVPILESVQTLLDDLPMRESQPGGKEPILQRELRNVRPSTGCSETDGETRSNGDCVCGLRNESLQTERLAKAGGNSDVFQRVQREVARGGMEEARTQRPSGMVGGNRSAVRGEYARGEQPSLEGRGDVETPEGELQGCSVCEVPAGVPEHVAEGWVCDGTSSSGGARNREALGENRGCASCESRSGGQSVGEPLSVRVESGSQAVRGARHTVADLAEIEPVRYEGIVWCLTVPTGAFVVRRNGKVFVTGNSGFPKSMDIGKAIDKARREDTEPVKAVAKALRAALDASGKTRKEIDAHFGTANVSQYWFSPHKKSEVPPVDKWPWLRDFLGIDSSLDAEVWRLNGRKGTPGEAWEKREVTGVHEQPNGVNEWAGNYTGTKKAGVKERRDIPATPEAAKWDGWGTALKPAIEPIILARKPLDGTVANNVLAHGVGGLNIDACRVPSDEITGWGGRGHASGGASLNLSASGADDGKPNPVQGRFPANVLLDEHAAKEMDEIGRAHV